MKINAKTVASLVLKNQRQVEKFMGYNNRPIPPVIQRKIEEELLKLEDILTIEYEYCIEGSEAYLVYTVGGEIEECIAHYSENTEMIRGVILDKASIVALDMIKDQLTGEIEKKTGQDIAEELYPSSLKLPISAQKGILDRMTHIKTISINEYFQLNPLKSVAMKVILSKEPLSKLLLTKALYYQDREAFHSVMLKDKDYRKKILRLYLEIALDTFKEYEKHKIPPKIYFDTMSDIKVWMENCNHEHGYDGIQEYAWVEKSLDMLVFKLGRLQFEKTKDEGCFHVHIQQGEGLDSGACEKSYEQATDFFQRKGKVITFFCDSWLLSPVLKEILPKTSNIIKFQSKYTILEVDEHNRQIEERIFSKLRDNPMEYEEDTMLQRAVKKILISGKKIGTVKGVYRREV